MKKNIFLIAINLFNFKELISQQDSVFLISQKTKEINIMKGSQIFYRVFDSLITLNNVEVKKTLFYPYNEELQTKLLDYTGILTSEKNTKYYKIACGNYWQLCDSINSTAVGRILLTNDEEIPVSHPNLQKELINYILYTDSKGNRYFSYPIKDLNVDYLSYKKLKENGFDLSFKYDLTFLNYKGNTMEVDGSDLKSVLANLNQYKSDIKSESSKNNTLLNLKKQLGAINITLKNHLNSHKNNTMSRDRLIKFKQDVLKAIEIEKQIDSINTNGANENDILNNDLAEDQLIFTMLVRKSREILGI